MELQVRFLVSAVIPSGGGALWSSSASRPTSPSSRIRGSVEFVSPRPGSGQRRIWMLKIWRLMCWFFAATAASSGVGSSEPAIDDFPSACGDSRRSKVGELRSGAPSTASASSPTPGSSAAAEIEMQKEVTGGTERAEEMETVASHKRLPAGGHETVKDEPKRPRDGEGDEEEQKMLADLAEWRYNWTITWSDCYGSIDKRTEVGPVRFTMGPVPSYVGLEDVLQIFSVKVVELKGTTICWPIDVYGFIAVRDSVDRNRNYIFERTRGNCQMLTEQDSSLVLNGPSRAVQLIDPVIFEVELRVKGTWPSEDKLLSGEFFGYDCIIERYRAGSLLEEMVSGPRTTLAFKYAHLLSASEAQIKVWVAEGSTDFSVKFVAHTASIDENVTLLECKDVTSVLSDDGSIDLSRDVVAVEGNNGVLTVGVQVNPHGNETAVSVYREVNFTAATSGESHGTLDVGFCKMSVVVAWSLLF